MYVVYKPNEKKHSSVHGHFPFANHRQSSTYWGGLGLALADLRAPSLVPGVTSRPPLLAGRPD